MILAVLSPYGEPPATVTIPDDADEEDFSTHRIRQAPPGSGALPFVISASARYELPAGSDYVFGGRFVFPNLERDYERFRKMCGTVHLHPLPLFDEVVAL